VSRVSEVTLIGLIPLFLFLLLRDLSTRIKHCTPNPAQLHYSKLKEGPVRLGEGRGGRDSRHRTVILRVSNTNQNPLTQSRNQNTLTQNQKLLTTRLGDEPKQIRNLDHLPQRTLLDDVVLTLVSVWDSALVLVWVWILIEGLGLNSGSVIEGEPLRQSYREGRGEVRCSTGKNSGSGRDRPLLHQTKQSSPFPRPRANDIERGSTRLWGGTTST
jgi:hypothetical protein